MRLLPCFAIPMHFSASPVPAMPKLFRARPKLFRTWRIHLLAFPHLSTPLLLTSVLFRCDSLRFGAFPTLFGSYPLLCVANQYHAQAILCCAKLCSSLAFQFYATAMHDLSMLHFSTAFQCCSGQLHSKSVSCFSPPFHRRATHVLAITRRVFPVRRISIACVRFFRRKFQRFSCRN